MSPRKSVVVKANLGNHGDSNQVPRPFFGDVIQKFGTQVPRPIFSDVIQKSGTQGPRPLIRDVIQKAASWNIYDNHEFQMKI